MSNARIALVATSVVFLAALVFVLAVAVPMDHPADAQGKNEATAPPPVRQDRVFGPPIEIGEKLVRSGEFVITYVDEEAFEADDEAAKEEDEGGREVTEILRQNVRLVDFEALKGEDKAEEMEAKKAELEERADVERVDYSGLYTPGSPYAKGKKALPESGGVSDVSLLVSGIAVALLLAVCGGGIVLVRKTVR